MSCGASSTYSQKSIEEFDSVVSEVNKFCCVEGIFSELLPNLKYSVPPPVNVTAGVEE